jgi:hypothetical protein
MATHFLSGEDHGGSTPPDLTVVQFGRSSTVSGQIMSTERRHACSPVPGNTYPGVGQVGEGKPIPHLYQG